MKLLQDAHREMGLGDPASGGRDADKPTGGVRLAAARCWALLLTRIFECLPLRCPKCGEPMRIIAFVLDPTVIERILGHIGEPTEAPVVLQARSPPLHELEFDQTGAQDPWPEMDQTASGGNGFWD